MDKKRPSNKTVATNATEHDMYKPCDIETQGYATLHKEPKYEPEVPIPKKPRPVLKSRLILREYIKQLNEFHKELQEVFESDESNLSVRPRWKILPRLKSTLALSQE
jgi:hypothetical protein